MDHYELAEQQLADGSRYGHAGKPEVILACALTHATLALADRLETLMYLMYGEE